MPFTWSRMNGSASPNPASGPVFGLTWPILMTLACALAELALSSAGAAIAAAPDLMSVRRLMRFIFFIFASLCFLSALILRSGRSPRLEGWGGHILRDASLRDAPQDEAGLDLP